MPETRFEIGEKEKHLITVELEYVSKRIMVEQDGALVAEAWHPSPLAKKFEFDVGGSEPHHIEITVGAFHPAELKVDGISAQPLP